MDRTEDQVTVGDSRRVLLRVGGVCAVVGAVVSVAAGSSVGAAGMEGTEAALRFVAARPQWYWPTGYLAFIAGALLWVGAFTAFVGYTSPGAGRVAAGLAAASAVVGATLHTVDGVVNGFALNTLARAWANAPAGEQAELLETGRLLLWILDGTWAGVITFFHGVPFVLIGLAVMLDARQQSWLGWVPALAGAGSIVAGVADLLAWDSFPDPLFIFFAVIISVWMVAIGVLMWRRA